MNRIVIEPNKRQQIEKQHIKRVQEAMVHGNMKNEENIKNRYKMICTHIEKELRKVGISITFEELIIADFEKLSSYIKTIEESNYQFGDYSKKGIKEKPFKKVYEAYDKLIRDGYNLELIESLNISVCPYCNRDFVNNRGEKTSAQLDHFYPRSKFPIFAVSLYNIIPSCYACNHIKSEKRLGLSPYEEYVLDELLTFTYSINDLDFLYNPKSVNLHILFETVNNKSLKENFEKLQLEAAYSLHRDEIQSILRKVLVFSEMKIDELWYLYGDLFESRDQIIQDIFGSYESEEYLNRILSKLKSDIYLESRKAVY